MTNAALRGKPDAGNPHVRFDGGEVASATTPRRGSLLYKVKHANIGKLIGCAAVLLAIGVARADTISLGDPYCFVDPDKTTVHNADLCNGSSWIDCWADDEDWAVVPINGAGVDDELAPVIVCGSADASMLTDIHIEDEATFKARLDTAMYVKYSIEATSLTDPSDIKAFVASRKWLMAKIKHKTGKFAPKTFFMGLKGGIEYRKFVIVWEDSDGADDDGFDESSETIVLPLPVGSATVRNNGAGARTVTVAPNAGMKVAGWSDDESNTSRSRNLNPGVAPYFVNITERGEQVRTFASIAGDKVEFDVEFEGYKATGLPAGLKYDAQKGLVSGAAKAPGEYEVTFTKKDEADEVVIFKVRAEEVSVGCKGLSLGAFTAGVAGNADGIPFEIETETGVKSVAVSKLPAGMKYDAKTGLITGGATKAGDYAVTVTVTTMSGAKQIVTIPVTVAAAADGAVGTFNGFVKAADDVENLGTFQLTTTDAGKLTAKVTTAAGAYSFSGTCWDSVEDGVYSVALTTKKGEMLTLSLDSAAGWNKDQLTGTFSAGGVSRDVVARKNAFGKTWYFNAEGDVDNGWVLSFAENAKAAALTVTLNADGSTKIAGKLGTLSANASGYADVTGLADGVIYADFAPVVSIKDGKTTLKRALSIRANLWFDRSNNHPEGVGTVKVVE